jgi:UPF0716 family protein affecting phage T7 exclusion
LLAALILAPVFFLQTGGRQPVSELAVPVLVVAGLGFAVLLPFLVLSFANGLYRQRLIQMLSLAPAPAPPGLTPPGAAIPAETVQMLKAAAAAARERGAGALPVGEIRSD